MAKNELHEEFLTKQRRIALGDRALVAIAAHVEVRSVLRESSELRSHGLDDVLIGSYARKSTIWPGKDVDVFGRLMAESIRSITADAAYTMFGRALEQFEREGRLTMQPRSFKVEYSGGMTPSARFIREAAADYGWADARVKRVTAGLRSLAFEFSVDVVPAVPWDSHYGIPETNRSSTGERYRTGQWRKTNPVKLTELTHERNREPRISSAGAFVRTARAVRQVKAQHLPDTKPSSLFYEFIVHEGFATNSIAGDSWADITASALSYVAERLATAAVHPVCDPVLREAYLPQPTVADLERARAIFDEQARRARRAVATDSRCQAAIDWRPVFGTNQKHQPDPVFPLPVGCRGTGAAMGAAAVNVSSGGTSERSFGAD